MRNLYFTLLAILIAVVSNGQTITGTYSVCVGATQTLTGTPTGSSWSVSDSSVATVSSSGVVTGIVAGTTYITYGGTVEIMTVNPNPAPITGTSLTVCVGETDTLLTIGTGGTWESSSPGIASIDSITGVTHSFSAGVFTITYTAPNSCFVTRSFTVNASPAPITGIALVCLGQTVTQANTTTGGTWSSSNTTTAPIGSATGIVTGTTTGTTTISYTLGTGCRATRIVTVSAPPPPSSGSLSVCVGSTTTLSCAAPGGTWSAAAPAIATIGSSTGIVTGVSLGTTVITYALNPGCVALSVITVNAIPGAITGAGSICVGSSATETSFTPGGTWSSGTPGVATIGTSTGVVTGVSAGLASITYRVASGCFATRIVTVNSSPAAITGTAAVCTGSSTTLSCATPGGTWSSSTTSVATISSTVGVATGVNPGSSNISYTVAGCSATTILTVLLAPSSITGPGSVCVGSTISLSTAFVGLGGDWSSSDDSVLAIIPTFTGISPGVATITFTLVTGCFTTKSVTVNPLPGSISGPSTVCSGFTVTESCTTTGGLWTSSDVAIATIGSGTGIVTGIANGTATITYTLASTGCSNTQTITVNATPAPITGASGFCVLTTTTLSDATTGGTWSSGDPMIAYFPSSLTGALTPTSPGTVTVTYTLPTGCITTRSETVLLAPYAITGPTEVCNGSAISLSNTISGGTWTSSDGAIASVTSAGVVTGNTPGTVAISYTLSSGCYSVDSITVNVTPMPITGTASICDSSTTSLACTTAGGTWSSTDASIASIDASGLATGFHPGIITISYTLTTGCAATVPLTVNANPAILGPSTVCAGSTITMGGTIGSGIWTSSNTAIASAGMFTGIISGLSSGVVTISYTLPTGCLGTKPLTVNTTPSTITGPTGICNGTSTTLTSTPTGGTWSSGTTSVATIDASGVVSSVSPGTTIISYTMGGSCASSIVFTVNTTPAVITGTTTVCSSGTTTLSTTPTGGTWTSSTPAVATIGASSGIVTPATAGTTTISYTLGSGCFTVVTVTIHPTPAITGTAGLCVGATTTLSSGISGGTWSSSSSTISVAAGVVSATAAGTATVTYALPTSCYSTVIATATATPSVSVSSSLAACGPLYTSVASGASTYTWTPATGITYGASMDTAFIYPTASTVTYTVTGTTAGCSGTTSFTLSGNRILGHLSFGTAAPSGTDARVWLIQYNPIDSSIMAQDSLLTCLDNGNPYYEFDGKPAGDYLVKAKLLSSVAGTSDYMPTYGGSAATWDVATPIAHTTGSDSLHIAMIYGTVPSGPGFISGYVYMGAGKGTATDVPVANMIIYLKNTSGQVLAYTYTDASGAYMFSAIAAGNYVIWPEEMSYHTISYPVSVSAGIPADNIGFKKITTTGIIVPWSLPNAVALHHETALSVYPNPATDMITVENAKGLSVSIFDMMGQRVLTTSVLSNRMDIDIRQLASGIYFVEAGGERFKIIKAEQ